MSRTLHAETDAARQQPHVPLLVLVELAFASGTARAHSGVGTINWGGNDWLGVGGLGTISPIEETDELQAIDWQLTLSGVDPTNIAYALGEDYHGRPCRIWLALLDDQHRIVGDPIGPWQGRMDQMPIEVGDINSVSVTVKSRLADWRRAKVRRWSDADQQEEYPGDKGLEFIAQMVEKELLW